MSPEIRRHLPDGTEGVARCRDSTATGASFRAKTPGLRCAARRLGGRFARCPVPPLSWGAALRPRG
eukprot:7297601-Alexandrium_andersonii.AAC.1